MYHNNDFRLNWIVVFYFLLIWLSIIVSNEVVVAFVHFSHYSSSVPPSSRKVKVTVASTPSQIDPNTNYFEWLGRQIELKVRPKPYQGIRLRIDRDLAVLLMRSSYQVTDDLDFVAMDAFQKDFFTLRQKEWEDYLNSYPILTVRQGDLTDPNYFDFISFAQHATINEEIRNGKLVFVEKINAEGDKQVVKRDAAFEDNRLLPAEHSRRVGYRILSKFQESPEIFAPQINPNMSFTELLANVKRIMDLFTVQKFNFRSKVEEIQEQQGGGNKQMFRVISENPANIWSLQYLQFRQEALLNDFEAKTIVAFLRACGIEEDRISYRITIKSGESESQVIYTFVIS